MDSDTAHELHVSRYTYDQEWIVAVDLGMFDVSDEAVTIDVVDETAIIVTDPPDGPAEFGVALPNTTGTAQVNNRVLTITSDR
jgi:hypothetical protein